MLRINSLPYSSIGNQGHAVPTVAQNGTEPRYSNIIAHEDQHKVRMALVNCDSWSQFYNLIIKEQDGLCYNYSPGETLTFKQVKLNDNEQNIYLGYRNNNYFPIDTPHPAENQAHYTEV